MQSHQNDVRKNPKRSIRKLASEANVSYGMMQTVLKIDVNLSPFKKSKAQVLSQTVKAKRFCLAKLLLKKTQGWQAASSAVDRLNVIHSQAIRNHQNDRIYAVYKEGIPLNEQIAYKHQKQASVMVWAGVCSTGEKNSPHLH